MGLITLMAVGFDLATVGGRTGRDTEETGGAWEFVFFSFVYLSLQ